MTEICSIIHKCTIHGEKNYMNLDFSSPLSIYCCQVKKKQVRNIVAHTLVTALSCHSLSVGGTE